MGKRLILTIRRGLILNLCHKDMEDKRVYSKKAEINCLIHENRYFPIQNIVYIEKRDSYSVISSSIW
jgi:hypothetical protein